MKSIFDTLTETTDTTGTPPKTESPQNAVPTADSGETLPSLYTPRSIKDTLQELIKYGLLEAGRKPNLYRTALNHHSDLNRLLEPLDLKLAIDDVRGLAFLKVMEDIRPDDIEDDDEWSHPLVRRQRLNMEQSLLVALLRQHFVAHETESGVGSDGAIVHLDDLVSELKPFLGDLGSEVREYNRLRNLLEKLKNHGIVSDIDANDQVMIRPLIAHLANPENLGQLLAAFQRLAAEGAAGNDTRGGTESDRDTP